LNLSCLDASHVSCLNRELIAAQIHPNDLPEFIIHNKWGCGFDWSKEHKCHHCTNAVVFFMSWMKAELEQEGCARAIRRSVHVILAIIQVACPSSTAWSIRMFTSGMTQLKKSVLYLQWFGRSSIFRCSCPVLELSEASDLRTASFHRWSSSKIRDTGRKTRVNPTDWEVLLYDPFSILRWQELFFFTGNCWEVLSIMSWYYSSVF
jgi:hypothetical protein